MNASVEFIGFNNLYSPDLLIKADLVHFVLLILKDRNALLNAANTQLRLGLVSTDNEVDAFDSMPSVRFPLLLTVLFILLDLNDAQKHVPSE